MSEHNALLPVRFLRIFIETISAELGLDNLSVVLEKANLSGDLLLSQNLEKLDDARAAQTYASLQKALHVYYGRGARGTLLRVGRKLWGALLAQTTFAEKTQGQIVKSLPVSIRRKPTLEYILKFMRSPNAVMSVHTLDMDLLLVDSTSAAQLNPDDEPTCFVTMGLMQEALYWATAQEHDVEETSCRSKGEKDCEFHVKAIG